MAVPIAALTNKVLSLLLATSISLTGLVYAGLTSRIGALEADKKDLVTVANGIAVQTAVVHAQVEGLQADAKMFHTQLGDLDERQQLITRKIDNLLILMSQNTKNYQLALKQWALVVSQMDTKRKD